MGEKNIFIKCYTECSLNSCSKTFGNIKNLCLQETFSCRALNNVVHAWHGIRVQLKMTVDKHSASGRLDGISGKGLQPESLK